jgi:hypothetical protein
LVEVAFEAVRGFEALERLHLCVQMSMLRCVFLPLGSLFVAVHFFERAAKEAIFRFVHRKGLVAARGALAFQGQDELPLVGFLHSHLLPQKLERARPKLRGGNNAQFMEVFDKLAKAEFLEKSLILILN